MYLTAFVCKGKRNHDVGRGKKELFNYVNFVNDEDGVTEICLIREFACE